MTEHLSDNDMAAYVDGKVAPEEREYIEGHLSRCAECREIVVFVFRATEAAPDGDLPNSPVE
jgi:anti-sigma factor RsiW